MTVTVAFTITFSSFLLEDDDTFAFEMREDFANDLCTFYGGSTHFYGSVVVNQQYFVKLDSSTLLSVQTVNIESLAGFGFELLSLDFYNYVHLFK